VTKNGTEDAREGTLVDLRPGECERNYFYSLRERIISIMYRLQLVSDNLDVSQKDTPGAYVVAELARELENLYDDFGEWHAAHDHTPKAPKEVQS
jgi:hypothetical protein